VTAGRVRIEPFGEVLEIRGGESVLAAILRQGRFVRYGCKHGGCGTCRAQLVDGDCELSDRTSFSLSDADRENGVVLLCSTYVTGGEAVFDVSRTMDLTADEFQSGGHVVEYLAEVACIEAVTHDLRRVRFRLLDPPAMRFTAGQYLEVAVPGSADEWRSYSMSSDPADGGALEIIVKLILGGQFSSALERLLRPGDRLRVRGPLGQFAVRLSHRPMVMVAGGAGMGPIRAMLLELARTGNARQVRFFYGARQQRDLLFMDELRALEYGQRWLRVTPALSCPEPGLPWDGEVGLITDVLAREIPDARGVEGYLCGSPGMIDAAIRVLLAGGCKEKHIYFDRFVPSGSMGASCMKYLPDGVA
jgi:NAD(P)H-flavin reductase/ferredoxin